MKEALKQKYGKSLHIEISMKPHDDHDQQTSDLAPTVQDSDEPGVEKPGDIIKKQMVAKKLGVQPGAHPAMPPAEGSPQEEASETPGQESLEQAPTDKEQMLDKMIHMQPAGSPLTKTLHERAREKMIAQKNMMRKGLKS